MTKAITGSEAALHRLTGLCVDGEPTRIRISVQRGRQVAEHSFAGARGQIVECKS